MRFMNDFDIARAGQTHAGDPVLEPAARTLANLAEWADTHSDGWAYWPKPARSAARLMALLERDQGASWQERALGLAPAVTPADVRAAYRPIRAFRTRQGADFVIVDV